MSGASDTLDPIAAAKRDIAGSKDLMAEVARDLGQQELWLARYQRAEERRERRIRLQEQIHRLKLRSLLFWRRSKRLVLFVLGLISSAATSLAKTVANLFAAIYRGITEAVLWLRPRASALARTLWRKLTLSVAWLVLQSRVLADSAIRAVSRALSWVVARSQTLGIAFRRSCAAFGAWTLFQAKRLARASARLSARAASSLTTRSRHLAARSQAIGASALRRTGHMTRAGVEKSKIASSWLGANAQTSARRLHKVLAVAAASLMARSRNLAARSQAIGASALRHTGHVTRAGVEKSKIASSWLAANAQTSARRLHKVLAVAAASLMARSRNLAARSQAIGASALRRTGHVTHAGVEKSKTASSWLAENTRKSSQKLHGGLLATSASVVLRAQALARMSVSGASAGLSRLPLTAKRRSPADRRDPQSPAHRALVIRRSTALIHYEPKQDRFSGLRAN